MSRPEFCVHIVKRGGRALEYLHHNHFKTGRERGWEKKKASGKEAEGRSNERNARRGYAEQTKIKLLMLERKMKVRSKLS